MSAPSDRVAHALVAGVRISHPDRVVFPELGVTKAELARYYAAIADWIVPHVEGRPLTLVRCPEGVGEGCLYMRHTRAWGPRVVRRVKIREQTKVGEYLVADDVAALVSLVQIGIIEFHTWNAAADDIERPNRIVWDLDPGPEVGWTDVVGVARNVRALARTLGLDCWVKTTGGRGLHVVAPILPARDWSDCLAFSRAVADALVRQDTRRCTTKFAKRGRESKILIDYLRNNRTNTSIAAYSSRARPGGPVSMPVDWSALGPRLDPASFDVVTVPRRLAHGRDPWAGYWTSRQRLSASVMRAAAKL